MSLTESWDTLNTTVRKTFKSIGKEDITHLEAFYTSTQTTEVTIRNSEIFTQKKSDDSGVGFRVVVAGNKVGFACTNTLGGEAVLKTGEKAYALAKTSSAVPNFALPEMSNPPRVNGLFDREVAEISVEETIEVAKKAMKAAEDYDKRVTVKDGRIVFEHGWRGIVNTLGIDFEEQETRSIIYLGGIGKQNSEVTGICYDSTLTRTADLKPETVGENVGKKVVAMFNPKPIKSFQGTAIFSPEAVSYQLFVVLVDALKGDAVIAKRSAWTEKLGQTVASENLTITDDATLGGGFSSRSFDDEGCSSKNTVLLRKGKLEGFLQDSVSAKTLKMENSGNASRSAGGFDFVNMIIGRGYRAKPQIYPSNLVIQTGSRTMNDLVSETEKGVLIEDAAGFPQQGSGIISAQLSRAFLIKNGEVHHPIKAGMVSGVAFDWFKQISGISRNARRFSNAVVPHLRMEEVKIVGA